MGSKGNEVQNKMAFVTVTGFGNRDRRIITEDRDPIGERIPIDVVKVPFDPTDGCVKVRNPNGRNGCVRNAVVDRGTEGLDDGGIHWISESPEIGEREDDATRCDGMQ
jgi:hypothetical protein